MTPHSMAHRDRQIADHPDDPAEVPHDPDGVSHAVVGVTAVAAVLFAMLVAMLLITGTWTGRIGAVMLVIVGIPLLIRRFAERDARVDVNA
ncbi:MAG: hypothetical protein NT062_01115, partial [Proteobacteria bacterium]|nr:hypothetical protein [Pseudomonadota bacterium]